MKLFFTKLRSYILVFCIPVLLVGVLLIWNDLWNTRQKAEAMHSSVLAQVAEALDSIRECCDRISQKTIDNPYIMDEIAQAEPDEIGLASWIMNQEQMSSFPVRIAIYKRGTQSIFLNTGKTPYSLFEGEFPELSASLGGLYSKMNSLVSDTAVTLFQQEDDPYSCAYLYPITNLRAKCIGTLCMLVPRTTVLGIFQRFFDETVESLAIFDEARRPLYIASSLQSVVNSLRSAHGSGILSLVCARKAIYYTSAGTRQLYCVVMPSAALYSQGTAITLLYPLIVLCVIVGCLLAVLLYSSHQRHLSAFKRQNDILIDKLDERTAVIHELVLRRLIGGTLKDKQDVDYNIQCANLILDKPKFYIAVFAFLGASCELDVLTARAYEVCCQITAEYTTVYSFSRTEENQLILLLNTKEEDGRKAVQDSVEKVWKALNSVLSSPCLIGIGLERQNPLNLNHAYVEANVAIQEKMNNTMDNVYFFDTAQNTDNGKMVIDKALIRECVKNGNAPLMKQTLERFFIGLSVSKCSDQMIRLASYDMINFCVSLSRECQAPLSDADVGALCRLEPMGPLQDALYSRFQDMSAFSHEKDSERRNQSKYNLIGFVQEHFKDPELSLAMISEQLGLSQPYISKLFKDETGQTFISYVKQVRLNYVRQKLIQTDLPVSDIIREAGYLDTASFSRSFKQSEGMTCGDFRKLKRAGI